MTSEDGEPVWQFPPMTGHFLCALLIFSLCLELTTSRLLLLCISLLNLMFCPSEQSYPLHLSASSVFSVISQ